MQSYEEFFQRATGFRPYLWQKHVAEMGFPDVLPVPTGLGKTEGVVLAWAWRLRQGKREPRHLVYCLPMRVLVRQTVERLRCYFKELNSDIRVYELMGGAIDDEWATLPEKTWVLVGTQDQLLSRALNRGYAMSRFEWPVHFGLLNNDCRWIVDEVQLMGPGLWTTAQLDWMRRKRFGTIVDCLTTWMSATVETSFLETTDRKRDGLHNITSLPAGIIEQDPNMEIQLRLAATRPIAMWPAMDGARPAPKRKKTLKESGRTRADFYEALANAVKDKHVPGTLSLVICNTVEAARRVYEKLPNNLPKVLLTSRFRRQDRDEHEKKLLNFEAKRKKPEARREHEQRTSDIGKPVHNDPGLICVSTQVVEAGVDISAHHLWSELAPWPSIIQRLGRLNRDGRDQDARAWFWEAPTEDQIGPYETEDVDRARPLIKALIPLSKDKSFYAGLKELEGTKIKNNLMAALQRKPEPMPRALDVHGLFSTEPDVHGGFTDVSAFVRGADPDADLTVVWRDWEGGEKEPPPGGDELDGPPLDIASEGCPVPFYRLRETLKNTRARAWIWNEENDAWEEIRPHDLRPGMVVMLHRDAGGYSKALGWTGEASDKIDHVPRAGRGRALHDDERTEMGYWATLSVHLRDARREAEQLCEALGIPDDCRTAVIEAAGWHDLGKAHPQWQGKLPASPHVGSGPWAKCPAVLAIDTSQTGACEAIAEVGKLRPTALRLPDELRQHNRKGIVRLRWCVDQRLKREELDRLRQLAAVRWAGHVPFRPGLRHEAASALAMWHRYREVKTTYPALAVYLVAAHHGKVRTVFRSLADGGHDAFGVPPEPGFLQLNDERWPLDFTVVKDGAEGTWTEGGFELSGHGWTGLVADLLGPWRDRSEDLTEAGVVPANEPRSLGPFKLAYLEALVRIADWRASAQPSKCIKPSEVRRDE